MALLPHRVLLTALATCKLLTFAIRLLIILFVIVVLDVTQASLV
jgi:hypothetical protein